MVFHPPMLHQLNTSEVAEWLGGELLDAQRAPKQITGVATLKEAEPTELSFVSSPKVLKEAQASKAGLLLVEAGINLPGRARIVVPAKQVWPALARLLKGLYAPPRPAAGAHPTAVIHPTAKVGEGASIGPYCVIGARTVIGARAELGPHCVVGDDCIVGEDSRFVAHVTLAGIVQIGARVQIHPGAVLGADGFKYEAVGGAPLKIPQVGAIIIEDDVEIGANCTIDRAFLHETRIGRFCKLDNQVHIAHNVIVGPGTLMAAQTAIAGSTTVGAGCLMGGRVGIIDQLKIGNGVKIGAGSAVLSDVADGESVMGWPHMPVKQFFRVSAEMAHLTELRYRVRTLEKLCGVTPPQDKQPDKA